jgi:hypothetical protein
MKYRVTIDCDSKDKELLDELDKLCRKDYIPADEIRVNGDLIDVRVNPENFKVETFNRCVFNFPVYETKYLSEILDIVTRKKGRLLGILSEE